MSIARDLLISVLVAFSIWVTTEVIWKRVAHLNPSGIAASPSGTVQSNRPR
jgi:hypothetical protein